MQMQILYGLSNANANTFDFLQMMIYIYDMIYGWVLKVSSRKHILYCICLSFLKVYYVLFMFDIYINVTILHWVSLLQAGT